MTEAEKRRERGREGRHQADLFYADDGMLPPSDPQWMHSHILWGCLTGWDLTPTAGKQ